MKSLEDENEIFIYDSNQLKRCAMKFNKCETCDSLRNKIEYFYEILSKLTMARENLDMILSDQRLSYNKVGFINRIIMLNNF